MLGNVGEKKKTVVVWCELDGCSAAASGCGWMIDRGVGWGRELYRSLSFFSPALH